MSRHTAGPWSTYGDRNGRVSKIESRTGRVCTIQRSDKNGDANARLIAAAPELLDQHEADMEDLTLLLHAINEGDPKAELVMRVEDMKRRKRAAIARATQPLPPTNEDQP